MRVVASDCRILVAWALLGLLPSVGIAAKKRASRDTDRTVHEKVAEDLKRSTEELKAETEELTRIDVIAVRKAIEVFRASKKAKEKLATAQELSFVKTQLEILEGDSRNRTAGATKKLPVFTLKERAALELAVTYVHDTQAKVDRFEEDLSAEEIKEITADNPRALARITGKLQLFSMAPLCTPRSYETLKREVGLDELAGRAIPAMALASVYEEPFTAKYVDRVLKIVKSSPKYLKDRDVLVGYYEQGKESAEPEPESPRVARAEKELVAQGVKKESVRSYVQALATKSPECLGRLNTDFVKQLRTDVAKERGKYLLGSLRSYIATRKEKPDGIPRDIDLTEGHPIQGFARDPWGNEYDLRYTVGKLSIVSPGPDGEMGTADDMLIGPVGIP